MPSSGKFHQSVRFLNKHCILGFKEGGIKFFLKKEVSAKERSGWLGATGKAEQVTGSICAILFFGKL